MRALPHATTVFAVALVVMWLQIPSGEVPDDDPASRDGAKASSAGPNGLLGHLTRLHPGRSARVSSAAPGRSSNWDNRRIEPGATHVLAEIEGPGTIQHIWMTFPTPAPSWLGRQGNANHSELVLRIYWDGAEQPAGPRKGDITDCFAFSAAGRDRGGWIGGQAGRRSTG